MWVSEVKSKITKTETKPGFRVNRFFHRERFETLEEGLEWARDLAFRIVDGGHWTDEEIMMNHFEIKG